MADTVRFLKEADLEGPAALCHAGGVCGEDLFQLTEESLCADVRLSRFAAGKVLAAKEQSLSGT